jgi:hypothetical protein
LSGTLNSVNIEKGSSGWDSVHNDLVEWLSIVSREQVLDERSRGKSDSPRVVRVGSFVSELVDFSHVLKTDGFNVFCNFAE